MASITKLPSGAYRVQVRRKGRYASETFLRHDDAQRWARQAESRVDQGSHRPGHRPRAWRPSDI